MPNWCNNFLKVSGDVHELNKFKELTLVKPEKGDDLNFTMEVLYPTPADLLAESGANPGWYSWRVDNWGTKWDVAESCIGLNTDTYLEISYDTAWGPNSAFIQYAAKAFPTLSFSLAFEEPGMGFCGLYEVTGHDEDLMEGELEYQDEESGRAVHYDNTIHKYRFTDDNEIAGGDDEDYWPQQVNPFINN
jgi:hypothetical protein